MGKFLDRDDRLPIFVCYQQCYMVMFENVIYFTTFVADSRY